VDQSNSAGAVRAALDACGLTWAVPHTFRRTVAPLLDQANLPIAASGVERAPTTALASILPMALWR
jgi:hypothetical protein